MALSRLSRKVWMLLGLCMIALLFGACNRRPVNASDLSMRALEQSVEEVSKAAERGDAEMQYALAMKVSA